VCCSFDYGPAHIITINTEVYFFQDITGPGLIGRQKKWLKEDLKVKLID